MKTKKKNIQHNSDIEFVKKTEENKDSKIQQPYLDLIAFEKNFVKVEK